MQLNVKMLLPLVSISLILILLPSVTATIVDVTLQPLVFVQGKDTEFSLTVENKVGGNVNEVELILPRKDNNPVFIIKEISSPAEWTFETRYSLGASSPFKIIWKTGGSGIAEGESLTFNFLASSNEQGKFTFEWKTFDLQDVENFGSVQVKSAQQAFGDLQVEAPNLTTAGSEFNITVTALDIDGKVKKDYTGLVKFTTTDNLAIIPSDYTFQLTDAGTKTFKVKLKTAGEQQITVEGDGVKKTVNVNVTPADVAYIDLTLNASSVAPGDAVQLKVTAFDVYNNSWDVTSNSNFMIDEEAKGQIVNDSYISEVEGTWTLIANYLVDDVQFSDGEILTVTKLIEKPSEKPIENITASAEIISDDVVQVPVNETKLFSINVKNTGDIDLPNVSVTFRGLPEEWMSISPDTADIPKGKSFKFTATILVPEKVEPREVDFLVVSKDLPRSVFSVQKKVTFNFTEVEVKPTGRVVLTRNLTYLGIAIVIAVILILLFWMLFLREEPKKKRSE